MLNHIIVPSSHGTSLLVIEALSPSDPQSTPHIRCRNRSEDGTLSSYTGRTLGHAHGRTCGLVIKIIPQSIVDITGFVGQGREPVQYFQIDKTLQLIKLKCEAIPPLLLQSDPIPKNSLAQQESLEISDDDLSLLFSITAPQWLELILLSQLEYWRVHHVENFCQFTPGPLNSEELWRCAKGAPFWALARWKKYLRPSQIDYCARRSARGAILYAIDRISGYARQKALDEFPAEALFNSPEKLTNRELLKCAAKQPQSVFEEICRNRIPPARRAQLWSSVCRPTSARLTFDFSGSLRRDVLESIAAYPLVWLSSRPKGFAELFRRLDRHLSIRLEGDELNQLIENINPSGKVQLFDYIASEL